LKFLQKFKRITYSTSYLPEVDGLRFLAIFSVVVIMHIPNYLNDKFYHYQFIPQGYWKNFSIAGGHGVGLFFVISGFILSLPFAKWRLNKGKKISLKNYYLRRVTRLEPPLFCCFDRFLYCKRLDTSCLFV
jgi:peptidoglycan/LPS O-acetylase OafA/YrhL